MFVYFLTFLEKAIKLFLLIIISASFLIITLEVKMFNEQFHRFNKNISEFNSNVPLIVFGVSKVEKSVVELQRTLEEKHQKLKPELVQFNSNFEKLNYYLPYLINESFSLRKELPEILKEIEKIVGQAEDVSKAASEGAVEGAMRGVLSLPAELISSIITLPFETAIKAGEKVVGFDSDNEDFVEESTSDSSKATSENASDPVKKSEPKLEEKGEPIVYQAPKVN